MATENSTPQDGDPIVPPPPIPGDPPAPDQPPAPDPNAPPAPDPANPPQPEPPIVEDDDRPEEVRFWEPVLAEHGITEEMAQDIFGQTERLTPDAVRVYGNRLIELTAEAMEERWKQEDARAYAYRLHRRNGGSDEDFLAAKTSTLPDEETLTTDINLQRAYWKNYLMRTGLEDDQAAMLVEDAAKKGNLKEKALGAFARDAQQEQSLLEQIEQANQQAEYQLNQSYMAIDQRISELIERGDGMKITIPAAQKTGFRDFLESKLVHDGRNFMFELPINTTPEEFAAVMQGLFLIYNKADVGKMIVKKAPGTPSQPMLRAVSKVAPPAKNDDTPPPAEEVTVGNILRRGARRTG